MKNRLTPQLIDLLEDAVRKQRPTLAPLLAKLKADALSEDERRALIDVISSEFCASGLGADDEPNERGLLLETLLDRLNAVGSSNR